MQAVLHDLRSAPISDALRSLLTLIEKAAHNSVAVTHEDVDTVRAAGWSDEAIYDAITVCALFRFYNTWTDATGVSGLPDYTMSGQQLAKDGYMPTDPPTEGAP